jgi:lambda repressor-like predicted transcriptional regulator
LGNEKSYFQAEFGNFKNSESGETGKNWMRNLILCDLKKNGSDSSTEAKVMAVLSLDSESGFLSRCWKGGGSVLWIGSVLEIGSILWIGSF